MIIDNFDQTFNDGNWHQVSLSMGKNEAILTVDQNPMITTRLIEVRTGAYYLIGGGLLSGRDVGFIGCMRQITIDGQYRPPTSWKLGDEYKERGAKL